MSGLSSRWCQEATGRDSGRQQAIELSEESRSAISMSAQLGSPLSLPVAARCRPLLHLDWRLWCPLLPLCTPHINFRHLDGSPPRVHLCWASGKSKSRSALPCRLQGINILRRLLEL